MTKPRVVLAFFISAAALCVTSMVSDVSLAQAPVASAQPTITAVPQPTPSSPDSQDMLSTYREVLDASKATLSQVQTTTENILTLVGVLFGLLTAAGVVNAIVVSKSTLDVSKDIQTSVRDLTEAASKIVAVATAASTAVQEAERTLQYSQEAAREALRALSDLTQVRREVGDLSDVCDQVKGETARLRGELASASAHLSQLDGDVGWYTQMMRWQMINSEIPRLYRIEDEDGCLDAVHNLEAHLRLTDPASAIFRYQVARSFHRWAESAKQPVPVLEALMDATLEEHLPNENEPMVRMEIEATLEALKKRAQSAS